MSIYAIGDVQGCYSCLQRLLEKIQFDPSQDQLWFCGDLVNRGPESLQTLRFIKSLGNSAKSVLGNHDLHLLAVHQSVKKVKQSSTLLELLNSHDCEELIAWLTQLPLAHYDSDLDVLMVHAGIHPQWSLDQTQQFSLEVEQILQSSSRVDFLQAMYGNQPTQWNDNLEGMARLRFVTNVFTRMRFLTRTGDLEFEAKGGPSDHSSEELIAWFDCPSNLSISTQVVFGHWSTLPAQQYGRYFALDGGCVWGGKLLAVELSKAEKIWFAIECAKGGL